MKKELNISKKNMFLLIVIIILIIIEAAINLKLPQYTSSIVNTKILKNGFSYTVPYAITENEMDNIILFASEEEKINILKNYDYINQGNTSYSKKYNVLNSQSIYLLKDDITNKEKAELEVNVKQYIEMTYFLENLSNKDSIVFSNEMYNYIYNNILAEVPKETSNIFMLLKYVEEIQIQNLRDKVGTIYSKLGEEENTKLISSYLKQEYEETGASMQEIEEESIVSEIYSIIAMSAIVLIIICITKFVLDRVVTRIQLEAGTTDFSGNEAKKSSILLQNIIIESIYSLVIMIGSIISINSIDSTFVLVVDLFALAVVIFLELWILSSKRIMSAKINIQKLYKQNRSIYFHRILNILINIAIISATFYLLEEINVEHITNIAQYIYMTQIVLAFIAILALVKRVVLVLNDDGIPME